MRHQIIMTVFAGAIMALAPGQPGEPAPIPSKPAEPAESVRSVSHLALRTNPFLSLHLLVRAAAAGNAEAPPIEGFDVAVATARKISENSGDRAWALIDGGLAGCTDVEQARAWAGAVRLAADRPNARQAEPTPGPKDLIEALAAVEPAFLEKVWPAHQQTLNAASAHLRTSLLAKEAECVADATSKLGITDPVIEIPVYLVVHAPPPGGITYRTRGGAVCIVDVSAHRGTALDEAVLHESLHAIDVASTEQPTVLNDLRARLRGDGLRPSPGWREVPHTVIFVQAAATIRRVIDPQHQDYGITGGYYDRVKPAAEAVRPVWAGYIAGTLTRDEAVSRMVDGYHPPAPPGE
ncbi:MAG: hypothetical protein IT436_05750 [Phycisphaerales bacterium]|nr:hypothetical protein [Phycisphaerales bacterium]